MTDDLVKRHIEQLRLTGGDLADLCQPIADAIDALTAERDHAWEMAAKADTQMGQSLADNLQAKAERDRLREALESLHGFANGWRECGCGDSCYGRHAERNMVLDHLHDFATAALKGETP